METDEFMIPVSEYASLKGLSAQEVIEMIRDGSYGYRGKQDAQGSWLVDRRSPFMHSGDRNSTSADSPGSPVISKLLYILAWLGLFAAGGMFYQMMDLRGGQFVGRIILAAGVISFALFSALASGLTYLRQIEANTRARGETDREV